jgi:septal ring factor EnvC (AmiA/AmiB activator)
MSDKIFKYKVIVEAVDKPLKSMQEQLKSINDIFKKQTDEIKKTTEAVNSLANTYKKFEIGKLAMSLENVNSYFKIPLIPSPLNTLTKIFKKWDEERKVLWTQLNWRPFFKKMKDP